MKSLLPILISFLLFSSCFSEKSDEYLLEKDKKELAENLDSDKVNLYKFAKISLRAQALRDSMPSGLAILQQRILRVYSKTQGNTDELSALEYASLYRDYRKIKKFVEKTDEDIFPTLLDAQRRLKKDTLWSKTALMSGQEKITTQNIEHAILSAVVLPVRDLGKEISLYECSKTHPDLLPDSEPKTLLAFFRGFLFFEKGLYYLAEDGFSQNINWLDSNPKVELPLIQRLFQWQDFDNQKTYTAFHGINHLFRGLDRLMMERDVDEERALEDFEAFLADSKKLDFDNELTWSIEAYYYLKNGDNEKAIASLTRLKASPLLSADEKEAIGKSIQYMNDRKEDKVLNGLYDKYFLAKIGSKYIMAVLKKVDWEQVLILYDVPYAFEMMETLRAFKIFTHNMNRHSSGESLKEAGQKAGKEAQEKSKKLWDKAKGALDE